MYLNQSKLYSTNYLAYFLFIVISNFAVLSFAKQPIKNSCSEVYLQLPGRRSQDSNSISPKKSPKLRTENLLNYLSLVFNQQQVSLEALTNMLRSLEQGQLTNPGIEKEALNSSIKKVIRNGIKSSISRNDLDIERLLQGLRIIVKEETRQEERRGEAHEKTTVPVFRPTFHDICPGEFVMREIKKQVKTEITIPFAMMNTQVTQYMWARLKIAMGERAGLEKINPSHFKTGAGSMIMNIDGLSIQMKPDHPVEQVSWEDVIDFIDGLNLLSNQDNAKTQKLLEQIISGHKKGDIYDLPTEAQWGLVMSDRGNADKKHFDRDDESALSKHAWFFENADNQTHEVRTKLPRMIDGLPFYDFEGNVLEWVKNVYDGTLYGGMDPQGPIKTISGTRILLGGSWRSSASQLSPNYRSTYRSTFKHNTIGFRLVRTRP